MANVTKATKADSVQSMKIKDVRKLRDGGTRVFVTDDDLVDSFIAFCEHIREDGYIDPPTYTNFARWYGCHYETFMQAQARMPKAASVIQNLVADTYVEGVMEKKYRDVLTVFTLKNRCGWTDKKETTSVTGTKDIATPEEAKEQLMNVMGRLHLIKDEKRA